MSKGKTATRRIFIELPALLAALLVAWTTVAMAADKTDAAAGDDGYSQEAIMASARNFFGGTTEGLAKVIEKAFQEHGKPTGFIAGEEVSGAVGVGLRYGEGQLNLRGKDRRKVFWQGPSIGFDLGGNASKVFVLVYNLKYVNDLFQRFPAADGSLYVIAGASLNYQQSGEIILAPIRTGVGLRAGVNVGYMHYTKEHSWIPL